MNLRKYLYSKNTKDKNLSKLYELEIINFEKKIIKASISSLGKIKIQRQKVQKQYEAHPYPRWNKINKSIQQNYNYIIQTEIMPTNLK